MASALRRRPTWSGIGASCAAGAFALAGCSLGESSRTTTIGSMAEAAPPSLSAEEFGSTPSPAPSVASQQTATGAPVATDIPAPPFPTGKTNVAKQPVPVAPPTNDFSVAPVMTEAAPTPATQPNTIQPVQHLESGEAPVAVIGEPPALPLTHSADHGPPIMTPWGEVCPHCQPVTAAIWKRKAEEAAAARNGFAGGPHVPQPPSMAPYTAGPQPYAGWRPDGLPAPWPLDEWIFDGGDANLPTVVDPDWVVRGLDIEDAVGHFDTLDGETVVSPSNRVAIYAPRFAAVRQTRGVVASAGRDYLAGMIDASRIHGQDVHAPVTTALQPIQPQTELGQRNPISLLERQAIRRLDGARVLARFVDTLQLYEDFHLTRTGEFLQGEKPRLAKSMDAAMTWTDLKAVQVIVDEDVPLVEKNAVKPDEARIYERQGVPCIRVVKMASKGAALPGEEIEFTLRYDNIGEQLVGNVTILDNLTTRLEYIEGTAQSSREAEFFVEENEARSLVLRWEIVDPLPVGQGGIVRFRARVR
ncbi:MAG TPA: hypothetical protein VGN57_20875 [Pirellulaceae bacterium]|nr:hypothetical protein [Pirellulaceae bacterium]